jgi:hypothetical protein
LNNDGPGRKGRPWEGTQEFPKRTLVPASMTSQQSTNVKKRVEGRQKPSDVP